MFPEKSKVPVLTFEKGQDRSIINLLRKCGIPVGVMVHLFDYDGTDLGKYTQNDPPEIDNSKVCH